MLIIIKTAISKSQIIFLKRYSTHDDVVPKSFRIKRPIKLEKAIRMDKWY